MKIVVRGTNWIGDAIMTIPALRELRRLFPDARISLYTRAWAEGIFRDAGFIDELIPFEKVGNSLHSVRKEARIWRGREFDLAVLFTNSFQTALLSKLGRAKRRFGYRNEGRSFLLTDPVGKPSWRNERHEVFYYLNLITEIENAYFRTRSATDTLPDNRLAVSDDRKAVARQTLANCGIDPSKKTVALGVGSTNSRAKRWMPEGFAALNDLLHYELGANVILVGSADELNISQIVSESCKSKPVVLTGRTSLAEAVALLSEVDLLVSNDMGLAHVSSAVGTKTLTIFGPTNPVATAPWKSEIIVREDIECAPCMLRDCPIDHPCMKLIRAEQVFDSARKMLDEQI